MCGIAGILSADAAKITPQRLKDMTAAIAHRGPDGEGVWISPSGVAGLGHRRLSIIDLSPAGAQPMHYLNRYTIIHNGELYNYLELRDILQAKGYTFYSRTDTEVIAAAFDHFGAECLQYFDGMFAFAIWDETTQRVFIARDRFGEKPLFFYHDAAEFLFASELKALWAAGVKKESNLKMIFNFLTIGYTQNPADAAETFFQNIYKLPARSFLFYHPVTRDLEISAYWDIEAEQTRTITEENAIETFSRLFHASVHRRLRSDVRVGTSLSGGLDSSSVVACILKEQDAPVDLPTFSALFPGFEKDESAYIGLLTRHYSLQNHPTTPTAAGLIKDFERLVYHQEEPFLSSSIYAQWAVYELAARNKVKVLLDGQGADELLAGYHKYYNWYWQELYRRDKKTLALELEAARESGVSEGFTWKNRLAAWLPGYTGVILKKARSAQQRRSSDLSRDFIRESGVSYYDIPHIDKLNGVLYYNTFMNGMEELLRYADRNSMAHGVEVRLPFLDHTLVEFVFSLPAHFKIRRGWTKWLLRRSMEDILPGEIAWRKDKTGFEPPQKTWMEDPMMQEYLFEARRTLVKAGILTPRVLQKKIQPQEVHAAENRDWRYLVTAASLFA
ncbi:asparagine synthase (glutamine-hydrolyzing) [Puia dinghuensis]|uniref:asparagine synthase (glutamine-hydrolyzing) n=1 Tax=Puia dinghuensis TaxID=1792502 RepID=A0A8J2UFA0_9BACT|nr:asparagine synthase (glutamine-hydrolyzing) [Puia dinghuensis]GGB09712.1 asparagine synthetase B [Puia dinghuensis]